uniref:Embryogenesis transmembrane protein n=1 Tax=Zea mays TaxID=4577 RepID=B6U4J6_MAIZE|nr:embryogenesis transmembrane protein [Zea mays]|eukprot:NP_001151776.1 embryogenesis transmembrane protein [Zea mays]
MSCPINVEEAQRSRAITVADSAPGDATPAVTEISATGKRGIPVLVAPLHSQRECDGSRGRRASAEDIMSMGFQGFLLLEEKDDDDPVAQRKKWFKEMRGWLMVLATVAASVTYQAGLNPPGGFWQDGDRAGNPVLRDRHWSRYMIFYYLNATAFVTSLVIMVLLMNERFYHTETKVVALMLTTFIDLISLIGAYIAGTTRFFSSCIYIIVITCVAFAGVIYFGEVMAEICKFTVRKMPCMLRLTQNKWFPMPAEVVKGLQQEEERISQKRTTAGNGQRGGCCACCAPRAEG